jgi:hypothetical protein
VSHREGQGESRTEGAASAIQAPKRELARSESSDALADHALDVRPESSQDFLRLRRLVKAHFIAIGNWCFEWKVSPKVSGAPFRNQSLLSLDDSCMLRSPCLVEIERHGACDRLFVVKRPEEFVDQLAYELPADKRIIDTPTDVDERRRKLADVERIHETVVTVRSGRTIGYELNRMRTRHSEILERGGVTIRVKALCHVLKVPSQRADRIVFVPHALDHSYSI